LVVIAAEWKTFLGTWTREIAALETKNPNTKRPIDPVNGLGFPGATDAQIAVVESRLGVKLPPSYSEFLKATNGLLQPFDYVASYGGDFWPVEEIDWFRVRNAEWIEAYAVVDEALSDRGGISFTDELRQTLEISHDGDSAVYLLNPRVVSADGEWEAWVFATWSPEVERFPSFAAMMQARYREFRERNGSGF
jgi:SMI1 / KNR4 family (SUKH-1)